MKTIKCSYNGLGGKAYSFNIKNDEVKVGDILESPSMKGKLYVVSVEKEVYKTFDYATGELGVGTGVIKSLPEDTHVVEPSDNPLIF